jgi:hypothetical protein
LDQWLKDILSDKEMAAHVTAASVHDFKLFSYFFALFFDIFRYRCM